MVRIKSVAIGIGGVLGNFIGHMVCLSIVRPQDLGVVGEWLD